MLDIELQINKVLGSSFLVVIVALVVQNAVHVLLVVVERDFALDRDLLKPVLISSQSLHLRLFFLLPVVVVFFLLLLLLFRIAVVTQLAHASALLLLHMVHHAASLAAPHALSPPASVVVI